MRLEPGTEADRESLVGERALEWRGRLTDHQFLERNRLLYAHPFGRSRVQTWIWRDGKAILSSLDTVSVRLKVGAAVRDAWLIASVITPKIHRGHGHSKRLLSALFETEPERAAILFSDIDPSFYEKFGFKATVHEELDVFSASPFGGPLRQISPSAFFEYQKWARAELAAKAPVTTAWPEPDRELMDWQLERFRYFGSLKQKPFGGDAFFETDHAHVLALAPDPIHDRVDALWLQEDCGRCVEAGAARAAALGLGRLRYWRPWTSRSLGLRELPMVRVPGVFDAVPGSGVQLGDWW